MKRSLMFSAMSWHRSSYAHSLFQSVDQLGMLSKIFSVQIVFTAIFVTKF